MFGSDECMKCNSFGAVALALTSSYLRVDVPAEARGGVWCSFLESGRLCVACVSVASDRAGVDGLPEGVRSAVEDESRVDVLL